MAERDFRQEMTDKFVAALDEGRIPWERPWDQVGVTAKPSNAVSGREYTGANRMFLTLIQMDQGYSDPRWLTFNQARKLGGGVQKGEKGTPVEFWSEKPFYTRRDVEISHQGKPVKVESEHEGTVTLSDKRKVPANSLKIKHDGKEYSWKQAERRLNLLLSQVHVVFNVEQCRGIGIEPRKSGEGRVFTPIERGEQILEAMAKDGIKFSEAPNRAFYSPMSDSISLPPREHFKSNELFYGVALHECGHSTGHESRLNRPLLNQFGTEEYAKEELVAEMTSAFIAAETGIPRDIDDHKAYIQSWASALKNDKNELFRAARQAGQAADYIIAREQELAMEVGAEYIAKVAGMDPTAEHDAFLEKASIREVREAIELAERNGTTRDPELNLKEKIGVALAAPAHNFLITDPWIPTEAWTHRLNTAESAIQTAEVLESSGIPIEIMFIDRDGSSHRILQTEGKWANGWVRESDAKSIEEIQKEIDRESFHAIEERAELRRMLPPESGDLDKDLAQVDISSFRNIQDPEVRAAAADMMLGQAELCPGYREELKGDRLNLQIARKVHDMDVSETWRFKDGFVDDALYYWEGQKRFDALIAQGKNDEAYDVAGSFNLAHQQELSGFTLESFARDYDAAQLENVEREAIELAERNGTTRDPELNLKVKIGVALLAPDCNFRFDADHNDVIARLHTAESAIQTAERVDYNEFLYIARDGSPHRILQTEGKWANGWVRESDAKSIEEIQKEIDRESLHAIEERAELRRMLPPESGDLDKDLARVDIRSFRNIQDPEVRAAAADMMLGQSDLCPGYREELKGDRLNLLIARKVHENEVSRDSPEVRKPEKVEEAEMER